MKFLIRIIVIGVVSFGLSRLLPGIHVDTLWTAIVFALVLALLNFFIKPILILFTLPATLLTLGLFLFVINAIVVLLASHFVDGIAIDGFWWALLFSLILSLAGSLVDREFQKDKRANW
jgi:putative membrane protein